MTRRRSRGSTAGTSGASSRTSAVARGTPRSPPTLAILNGTTVSGLARTAADKLIAKGYREPNVVTNETTDRQRKYSEVFYEPGYRAEALSVADCLHIRFDRVHQMNANARALADRAICGLHRRRPGALTRYFPQPTGGA